MNKSVTTLFIDTQIDLLRQIARHVKQRAGGRVHYSEIERLADELEKCKPS